MGLAADLLKRRWSVAIVMVILATAGLVASVTGRWAHDVLLDTDGWLETVGPIGTSEPVTDALSARFSRELIDWIDAEARIGGFLPPIMAPLAGEVAGFVDGVIVEETDRFFGSDLYANAWLRLNETVHTAAVSIVRDQVSSVSTAGGVVTVDLVPLLTPVVDAVFDRLIEFGDTLPDLILNQVDFDETVAIVIAGYEEEGLPEWLSDIEVYNSERLATVQRTTASLDRLVWVAPVVTLLFAAGAIYFAPSRWLMGAILLGAAAVGWLAARLVVTLVVNSIVAGIESSAAADVAHEVFTGVTEGLTTLLVILASVSGVSALAVVGWMYLSRTKEGAVLPPSITADA